MYGGAKIQTAMNQVRHVIFSFVVHELIVLTILTSFTVSRSEFLIRSHQRSCEEIRSITPLQTTVAAPFACSKVWLYSKASNRAQTQAECPLCYSVFDVAQPTKVKRTACSQYYLCTVQQLLLRCCCCHCKDPTNHRTAAVLHLHASSP